MPDMPSSNPIGLELRWPTWLRWILVLPAAAVAYPVVAGCVYLLVTVANMAPFEPHDLFEFLRQPLQHGYGLCYAVVAAARIAPGKPMIVAWAIGGVLTSGIILFGVPGFVANASEMPPREWMTALADIFGPSIGIALVFSKLKVANSNHKKVDLRA